MEYSSGLKRFAVEAGDANGQSWKMWKRSFELYLLANKIENDEEKVTLLLLQGGHVIQQLFDRLPNATVRAPSSKYMSIIRHILKKMEQGSKESMGDFVVRLREQGSLCEIDDIYLEILLIDQIVEKGRDREMRSKILKDNLNLNEILKQARIYEGLSKHVKEFESTVQIADINIVHENKQRSNYDFQKNKLECFNCGRIGHKARDSICKATFSKCHQCNQIGHFGIKCRGNTSKISKFKRPREREDMNNGFNNKKFRSYGVFDEKKLEMKESNVKTFFYSGSDVNVDCNLGGIHLKMIIDSGSDANLIGENDWNKLKAENIQIKELEICEEKKFLGYASKIPMEIMKVLKLQ